MRSEIHDVQVSKAGCMSEYDGLDDCLSQKDLVQIWERFSLVHSKTHACKQSIEQMDQMGKFLKIEIMQTRFN